MKHFFIIYSLVAFSTAFAQKMNIGATQADFRFSVSGMTQINGKYVPVGLSTRPEAMDSLLQSLKMRYAIESTKKVPSDSMRLVLLERITYCYQQHPLRKARNYGDSLIKYENRKLIVARKVKEADMASRAYRFIWNQYRIDSMGVSTKINLLKAWINEYNTWLRDIGLTSSYFSPHILLATIYEDSNDDEAAENTVLAMLKTANTPFDKWLANQWLGEFYLRKDHKNKALIYLDRVIADPPDKTFDFNDGSILAGAYYNVAKMKIERKEFDQALTLIPNIDIAKICNSCRGSTHALNKERDEVRRNVLAAEIHLAKKEPTKALPFLQKLPLLVAMNTFNQRVRDPDFDRLWYDYYCQTQDYRNALVYLQKYAAGSDSVQKATKTTTIAQNKNGLELMRSYETQLLQEKADKERLIQKQRLLTLEKQNEIEKIKADADKKGLISQVENAELRRKIETERLQDEAKKKKLQQDYQISSLNNDIINQLRTRKLLIAGLSLFVLFAGLLFAQNRQKQRANALLKRQKIEIDLQRNKAEKSLIELKVAQNQLIQREKMASLGELTAGIAHEIQNPLNFVNNFSEVSAELVDELKAGPLQKLPESEKDYANEILGDLTQNLQKITQHGGRASGIVKGMLEHSRTSTGERQPTDLNALADEYLRLAYQGLRRSEGRTPGDPAKDKTFKADLITDFAPDLGQVDVVPQDIGRVLLNLFNNAFYAVRQCSKQGEADYQPTVTVRTERSENNVVVRVSDNGTGIPESIKAKIFQPFFTTKPTGEGTGLGLSLSYDIVTKGHGGTLEVISKEGEGTEFIVTI